VPRRATSPWTAQAATLERRGVPTALAAVRGSPHLCGARGFSPDAPSTSSANQPGSLLRHIEFLDDAIATFDRHVERLTAPQADALARLDTIPGVAVGAG
jgi:hypothetical protein